MSDTSPVERSPQPRQRRARTGLAVALGLLVVLAPVLYLALDSSSTATRVRQDVVNTDPLAAVRAAVGQTMAAGSYEMDTVSTSTGPPRSTCFPIRNADGSIGPPAAGSTCPTAPGMVNRFETHSIVNFDPYAMRSQTQASNLGAITTHVNSTNVWQLGGATTGYQPGNPGVRLTEYQGLVVGTIGKGPGALAMLSLASRGGYLNLEEASVSTAQPAGTGTVRGDAVTYFEVTIDITKLADAPDLSDVQRATIAAALPLLEQAGYTGTRERIGIDRRGYVREVTATTEFADGSRMERHSVLYGFGCAPKVTMPNEPPAPPRTEPCEPPTPATAAPGPTSTTAAPVSTTTSTAPPPASTTIGPPPTTTTPTTSATTTTTRT